MSGSTGWDWGALGRLFGGGSSAINQAIPAGTDYGAALGAMNPGMTGAAAVPNEAFNQTQPFDVSQVGGGSQVGGAGLAKALGDAGKSAQGQQSQQGAGAQAARTQLSQAPLGHPAAPVSLNNLVNLLAQHRQAYMQAAMGGGAAPAAQVPTRSGLLGF